MRLFFCLVLLIAAVPGWATPLNCGSPPLLGAGSYPDCDLDGNGSVDLTTITQTSAPAGVVTYLDSGAMFPNPLQTGGPPARDLFSFGDNVRAGELFDISNLTKKALIDSLSIWGASSSPSRLVWTLLWSTPSTTAAYRNDVTVLWDDPSSTNDIVGLQAAGSNLALASDPLLLDERGLWQVDSYVNGVFIHGWRFSVPEPGTLVLMGTGLLGVWGRRVSARMKSERV